ncbi:MAG TPA: formylglycine-generating enzyme family protein [Sedimentisphaerales bacterium]|nr:formylglycine-generating enzyme family protein [Sedimentisphaerales bacterium]
MKSKHVASVPSSLGVILLLVGMAFADPNAPALPDDLVDTLYPSLEKLAPGSAEAQDRQRQAAQDLGLPVEVRTRKTGIVLRLIPAGTFTMGSPKSKDGIFELYSEERPQHEVTLTRAFYCGKFEVTQGQWKQVMGSNPSFFQNGGPHAPVQCVNWDDCWEFLTALCEVEGVPRGTYRLLTEAQWEYACRAGTQTAFCYGNDLNPSMANFNGEYPYGAGAKGLSREMTTLVGIFQPNAWGLYDMHGNVWEWCQDWYGGYPSEPVTDPYGPASGVFLVIRGGSWHNGAENCRCAFRRSSARFSTSGILGLRLARTTPQ